MDQPAQEGDIRPGADLGVNIREGRGAGETRVDVDDGSAPLLCLQHKAEGDWVCLRHVRAHNHHAVSCWPGPTAR